MFVGCRVVGRMKFDGDALQGRHGLGTVMSYEAGKLRAGLFREMSYGEIHLTISTLDTSPQYKLSTT